MENDKKLGTEVAFPNTFSEGYNGMSKRLYITTKMIQGMLAGMHSNIEVMELVHEASIELKHSSVEEYIVKHAFKITDELLRQENL